VERLILASASPRRAELLRNLGVAFEVIPAGIDETVEADLSPQEMVKAVAGRKARDVGRRVDKGIVLAADTIVVQADRVMGKPSDRDEAVCMLNSLSGKTHRVYTGVTVLSCPDGREVRACECTVVKFRQLPGRLISDYVDTGEPFDKAGGYGIQGYGAFLIEAIYGCYYNVVGLPLARVNQLLESFGCAFL